MSYGGYGQSRRKYKDLEGRVSSFTQKITGRKPMSSLESSAYGLGDQQVTLAAVALAGSAAAYYAITQLRPAILYDRGELCPYRTAGASLAAGAGLAVVFMKSSQ